MDGNVFRARYIYKKGREKKTLSTHKTGASYLKLKNVLYEAFARLAEICARAMIK